VRDKCVPRRGCKRVRVSVAGLGQGLDSEGVQGVTSLCIAHLRIYPTYHTLNTQAMWSGVTAGETERSAGGAGVIAGVARHF